MRRLTRFDRSRAPNLTWRQGATVRASDRQLLRVALAAAHRGVTLGAAAGNVDDIELALRCRLDRVFLRGIVRNMIAVHGVLCRR
jgi:hypothetical protein